MSMNKFRKNGKLYIRLFLGLTICIALTLIVSSSIYYLGYTRIMQKDVYETDLNNLLRTSQAVAGTTESAQALSFQIYRNSAIAKLLFYTEPHPFDIQGAMNELNSYLASMPFIESIYVYNPSSGFYVVSNRGQAGIISAEELDDRDILGVLNRFQEYKPFTPIPRTYKIDPSDTEATGIYTYLCFEAIGLERKINSAVIVNLSASWINREIQHESGSNIGSTYILDDRGKLLSGDNLQTQQWGEKELALMDRSIKNLDNGYIISNFEDSKSLISYTAPDKLSWQYVRITPYRYITEKINAVRSLSIRIAAGILIGGFFISWLLSRIMYVPIHRIVTRMNALESDKRNASYTVRQNALRKLIQVQTFDADVQLEKLRRTGITFDFTKDYRLLYIRMDRFAQLKEPSSHDLLIYKFAIMNIGCEICSKTYHAEAVDLDEESILLLLNTMDAGEPTSPEWPHSMLKQIQRASQEYLHIGLTISVTPVSDDPYQLHSLFREVKEASLRRFFLGREAIIETDKVPSPDALFAFPSAKEKRMIDALIAGKTEDAKVIFRDILEGTISYPLRVAELAVTHMSMTVSNMLNDIEKHGSMQLGLGLDLVPPVFSNYETLEELIAAFSSFFDELKARMVDKRSSKQETLIHNINELIQTRFADPNLSLNWIATELNMSSFHISRVYRQQTLTAIVDAINHTRMDKAKALLQQNGRPIVEIAELTGYTNSSYFHRMFKKTYGVTPSEYRKANP